MILMHALIAIIITSTSTTLAFSAPQTFSRIGTDIFSGMPATNRINVNSLSESQKKVLIQNKRLHRKLRKHRRRHGKRHDKRPGHPINNFDKDSVVPSLEKQASLKWKIKTKADNRPDNIFADNQKSVAPIDSSGNNKVDPKFVRINYPSLENNRAFQPHSQVSAEQGTPAYDFTSDYLKLSENALNA